MTLDTFETRLLTELRALVPATDTAGAAGLPPVTPLPRRAPRRGRWAAAAAAAAVLAGAAALLPTAQAEPAWAVGTSHGRVDVQVNRVEDAEGLEAALAAEGVTADITYLPDGVMCAAGRYAPLPTDGMLLSIGSGDPEFRLRLDPGTVPQDGTLVIAVSSVRLPDLSRADGTTETHRTRVMVDAGVAAGPVGACERVPAA